eukprot:scaffold102481_cov43-Prasinocladus_malaysianus.AAC.1
MGFMQLFSHIAVKGAQAGSIIGAASVAPSLAIAAYKGGSIKPKLALDMLTNRSARGLAVGLVAVSALGAARVASLDTDGIQDRAYRLHYNEGQTRCDKFWMASTLVGAVLGYATGGAAKVVGTAALGGTAGLFLHGLSWSPTNKEE